MRTSTAADGVCAAAVDLFFEQGYGHTSVRDITAALRLTPGALYNHFRSKEELLYYIVSRTHADAERVTGDAILRAGDDPASQLAEVARALTEDRVAPTAKLVHPYPRLPARALTGRSERIADSGRRTAMTVGLSGGGDTTSLLLRLA